MNRAASSAGAGLLLFALTALLGWPLAATVLEAASAPRHLERVLSSLGLNTWAAQIRETWRLDPEPATGQSLDPAGTARMLEETGGVARPARLAIETLSLVGLTLILALPPGMILALVLHRTDVLGRELLLGLLVVGAFIPLPLIATAWLGAFGNAGRMQLIGMRPLLVGRTGAAVVHAVAALPWVVLIVGLGTRTVEPELEESAALDMPAWHVALAVTLRRSVGFIAGAALAVAVLTAGDMTVTDLLQVRTYAEEAYVQFTLGRGPADAAVVSLPPLVVLGLVIFALARALDRLDPSRLAAAFARSRVWSLGRWRAGGGVCLLLVVGTLLAMPLYGLLWRAGRVGGQARLGLAPSWSFTGLLGTLRFAFEESWEPIRTSLCLAAAAATAATALAWTLAWKIRRSRSWLFLVLAIVALTLATPGPVAGLALGLAYRWFPAIYDSPAIVVLAMVVRTLPFALLVLWPSLRILPPELLESATLDGLGPWRLAWQVGLPLSRLAILAAWLATFILGFGELPATNLLQPPGVTTITFRIWSLLHTGVESHLAGVALVTLGVIGLVLFAAFLVLRNGPGFRGRVVDRR